MRFLFPNATRSIETCRILFLGARKFCFSFARLKVLELNGGLYECAEAVHLEIGGEFEFNVFH